MGAALWRLFGMCVLFASRGIFIKLCAGIILVQLYKDNKHLEIEAQAQIYCLSTEVAQI